MKHKNLLLTGPPGIGKTTIIMRVAQLLGDNAVGFYTTEIRTHNRRQGFEAVSLDGKRAILAHVNFQSHYRISKYGVKPESLLNFMEEINICIINRKPKCLVIDEIGKMEFFTSGFKATVLAALESPLPVVATIMKKPHRFSDTLKKRPDVKLIEVTRDNRDRLAAEIFDQVISILHLSK